MDDWGGKTLIFGNNPIDIPYGSSRTFLRRYFTFTSQFLYLFLSAFLAFLQFYAKICEDKNPVTGTATDPNVKFQLEPAMWNSI